MKGKVKFFDTKKGYGFIQPDEGGKDIFVHASGLAKGTELDEGDKVEFDTQDGKSGKGPEAVDVIRC